MPLAELQSSTEWRDIYSPNYPSNYDNAARYNYLITSDSNYIFAEVLDLTLETNDHLYVHDGPNATYPLLATFTGTVNEISFSSSSGYMYVQFVPNEDSAAKGFHMRYRNADSSLTGNACILETNHEQYVTIRIKFK